MTERGSDGRFRVDFQAGGIKDVQQAFRTVLQATVESGKAAERASLETIRAHERTAREIRRIENQKEHAYQQMLKGMAREEAKALSDGIRAVEEAERKKAQIQEQYARSNKAMREGLQQREHEERDRKNEMWARRGLMGEVRSGIYRGVNAGMQVAGQAAQVATGVFGGFNVADIVGRMNKFQSAVTNMSNATYIPDMAGSDGKMIKGTPRAKREAIESFAKETSASTGYDKADLVTAWQTFIEKSSDSRAFTGATQTELEAGRKAGKSDEQINRESMGEGKVFLKEMAELAKASGSDLGQIMTSVGMMKAANTNITSSQMAETMRMVVGQGKLGSISIADLAKSAPKIMAGAGTLSMGQTEGQRALLGLSQIAMISAGTGPQAATATARFVANMGDKHDRLKGLGIETRAKDGALRDPAEVLAEIYRVTKGDGAALSKVSTLFGIEGQKPIQAVKATYTEAEREAKAEAARTGKKYVEGEAGAKAVLEQVQKAERMGYSKKDVATDFAAVAEDRAEKFARAKNAVQEQLETALLPALTKFSEVLPQITPAIVQFIEFISKNPMEGAGVLIGASIAKQMSAAIIQDILQKALGGAGGPIAGAIVTGFLAWKAMEKQMDEDAKRVADRGSLSAKAYEADRDMANAKTPEEKAAAKKKLLEVQEALTREAALTAEGDHSTTNDAGRAVDKNVIDPVKHVLAGMVDVATGGKVDGTKVVDAAADKVGLNSIEERVKSMDAVAKKHHDTFLADLEMLGRRMRKVAEEDAKSGHGHVPMSGKTSPTS